MTEGIEKMLLETKFEGYSNESRKNDFVAPQEITVQITLNEYRKLVETAATTKAQIDAANSDKYARENEIKDLKKKVDELRIENSELKAQLYELSKTEPEEESGDAF